MNETLQTLFGLLGGLAIFLYGMNKMSDALQKAAGDKMKRILGFLTKNPVMGVLAGALVTAVLQSSSATTVMIIGFVSAGLISMPQAISVIFGANIGTTMTAQLLAFKLSDYIYPIIFIGFIMYFISKKDKIKQIGMVIFSFGLLFEGIEIMGSVMKPLATSDVFIQLMGQVKDMPILGVALGTVMTLVVQSSSATIAVLQNFASQAGPDGVTSIIGLAGAIPILLGDNIGTTITAILASIGQSRDAKRVAAAHCTFNITGAAVAFCILPYFAKIVQYISTKGPEVSVISRQIANAHTLFNVTVTLIWLPLIPLMVRWVSWLIKGDRKPAESLGEPKFLDRHVLTQPSAALYLVSREIGNVANLVVDMLQSAKDIVKKSTSTEEQTQLQDLSAGIRELHQKVSEYIVQLYEESKMNDTQSEQAAGLLGVVTTLKRMAIRSNEILSQIHSIMNSGRNLSGIARGELVECFEEIQQFFTLAMDAVAYDTPISMEQINKSKAQLRRSQKNFRKAHLKRVQ
ncbi:MAG: Na/Pi cotransporter family protein, partial [Clostridia bacterium]|nr:Na/Pi cotransporter family protein [Clostridia bacterium]